MRLLIILFLTFIFGTSCSSFNSDVWNCIYAKKIDTPSYNDFIITLTKIDLKKETSYEYTSVGKFYSEKYLNEFFDKNYSKITPLRSIRKDSLYVRFNMVFYDDTEGLRTTIRRRVKDQNIGDLYIFDYEPSTVCMESNFQIEVKRFFEDILETKKIKNI